MRVALSTTTIFNDLNDYILLRKLKRYAQQYYTTMCYPCRPVIACKMNDASFLQQSAYWPFKVDKFGNDR